MIKVNSKFPKLNRFIPWLDNHLIFVIKFLIFFDLFQFQVFILKLIFFFWLKFFFLLTNYSHFQFFSIILDNLIVWVNRSNLNFLEYSFLILEPRRILHIIYLIRAFWQNLHELEIIEFNLLGFHKVWSINLKLKGICVMKLIILPLYVEYIHFWVNSYFSIMCEFIPKDFLSTQWL